MEEQRDYGSRPPDTCKEERDHRDRVDREDQAAPDQLRPDPPSRSAVECSIIFVVPLRQAKASKVVRRWGACSARG